MLMSLTVKEYVTVAIMLWAAMMRSFTFNGGLIYGLGCLFNYRTVT